VAVCQVPLIRGKLVAKEAVLCRPQSSSANMAVMRGVQMHKTCAKQHGSFMACKCMRRNKT
jgi:hypothetical protein